MFAETQDLPVYILLDLSDSMFLEAPPRADAARAMAAVLAGVSLNQFDRTGIYPFGADLLNPLANLSGRHNLRRVTGWLERLGPAGPTNVALAVRRFASMRLRSGLAVIISDFFDPAGLTPVLEAMRSLRHRLAVVQVTRAADAGPDLAGEVELVDCESGRTVDVTVTGAELERYRRAYREFNEQLLAFLAVRRAAHLRLDADQPIERQLPEFFVGGCLNV